MVGLASAGSGVAVGSGVGVAVGCGVEVGAAVGCGVSAAIVAVGIGGCWVLSLLLPPTIPRMISTAHICLTLASRGWQRASQAAIKGGHAEHIHANCDCEYAVRFDGRTSVAGYDPEAYLAQYNAAGGDINRMRRVDYAANKERINAQKRAAYEARKIRGDP